MTQVVGQEELPTISLLLLSPPTCICFFEKKKKTEIEPHEFPTNMHFKGCQILSLICILGKNKNKKVQNKEHHGIGKLCYERHAPYIQCIRYQQHGTSLDPMFMCTGPIGM